MIDFNILRVMTICLVMLALFILLTVIAKTAGRFDFMPDNEASKRNELYNPPSGVWDKNNEKAK